MEFRSATAAATLVIGALTVATGPANAEPAAPQHIAYSAKLVDKTVVTTLKGGTFELSKALGADLASGATTRLTEHDGVVADSDGKPVDTADIVNVVDVKDDKGGVLLTLPLEFHLAGVTVPVKPEVQKDNTVLVLTPDKPAGVTVAQPVTVKPIASPIENNRAMGDFSSQFGLATTIGTFVGTALGAVVGCLVTLPAGCVPGLTVGASVGGIIGSIAIGGPALVATGIDLLTTMQAADGTSKWADKPTVAPTAAPTTTLPVDQPK
ncbi:hypothetical protein GFY24_17350 [Nocardia sp. SYP-A9097]|uniref:hypothetical protein n=1 Tax=Nocardia sp. SYP-A9097 TaxID=2663237 RepID=UPI00129BF651|nr:hypothetical protein [Nocardia sp. SYP-A9097]MRH89195.1 hypothetical protein [Nocardia sp. SYP-A9097]